MKNFFRAVRIALNYRFSLLGIFTCSILVALFWGMNISTIYPVVDVVFHNKSISEWADESIDKAKQSITQFEADERALKAKLTSATGADATIAQRDLSVLQTRLTAERKALAWAIYYQPYAHRYTPKDPFQTLVLVIGLLMVGTTIKLFLLMMTMILVERVAQSTAFEIRNQFYRHTLQMDIGTFGQDRTSHLMARFTNDMNAITSGVSTLFGRTIREPFKMIACLGGAALICWRLLLLSLIVSPVAAFLIIKLARSIKRANRKAMEEMTHLYSHLSETFSGIKEVKAFTMERYERTRFRSTAKRYYYRALRIMTYNALARPTTELMGMAMICLAVLAGGYLVLNQETTLLGIKMCNRPLSIGAMITFYAMLIGVSDPARKIADVLTLLQRAAAGADRVYEMMDRKPGIMDPEAPQAVPQPFQQLKFTDVDFSYVPDTPTLRGINLAIPAGKTVAIVGPNGCGKSTLINLIPRFYDVEKGSISLDSVDLRDVKVKELRETIGVVTQQTMLFDDTIMNNIRYGSPNATNEQVIEAAQQAHAHRFIEEKLEDGYDTIVGERGSKLSGGQRQRIALARAILRDPAILILDEATSQVDIQSEQLIHQALRTFIRNRTTFMVTHRLSTLDLADLIIVMDAGQVIAQGTHEELLKSCDVYARLQKFGTREAG